MDAVELHATTDGGVWAREFCDIAKKNGHDLDEGWVIGWMANAIECGRTHGRHSGFEECRRLAATTARHSGSRRFCAFGLAPFCRAASSASSPDIACSVFSRSPPMPDPGELATRLDEAAAIQERIAAAPQRFYLEAEGSARLAKLLREAAAALSRAEAEREEQDRELLDLVATFEPDPNDYTPAQAEGAALARAYLYGRLSRFLSRAHEGKDRE